MKYMSCNNQNTCPCPKKECENNTFCCVCIKKHIVTDSVPYCIFAGIDGDKSMKSLYVKLKERFKEI